MDTGSYFGNNILGNHLQVVDAAPEAALLQHIPAVKILRRVWAEQSVEVQGRLAWRAVPAPGGAGPATTPHSSL
jgi:hypothetical protein